MKTLQEHVYAGISHKVGEEYDAPEDRLDFIIASGAVVLVDQPKPPKPPKGSYETRQMKADPGEIFPRK